jgi:hypothetical protein
VGGVVMLSCCGLMVMSTIFDFFYREYFKARLAEMNALPVIPEGT